MDLQVVDWGRLSAKQTLLWRAFLQHLLTSARSAGDVKEIFKRVASQPKVRAAASDIVGTLSARGARAIPHTASLRANRKAICMMQHGLSYGKREPLSTLCVCLRVIA